MTQLAIARMGHPVLHQRAQEVKVEEINSPIIQKLIADMIHTCQILNGAGLAAPQVFQPLRIVIYQIPEERALSRGLEEEIPLTVLINPEIEILTDEMELGWEGCFSIPDMMGVVPRYTAIRCRAYNEKGELFEQTVEGYHARVIQHECDHLDGMLYPMRMQDMSQFGFVDEIREALSA
jgi:peptide deformylase